MFKLFRNYYAKGAFVIPFIEKQSWFVAVTSSITIKASNYAITSAIRENNQVRHNQNRAKQKQVLHKLNNRPIVARTANRIAIPVLPSTPYWEYPAESKAWYPAICNYKFFIGAVKSLIDVVALLRAERSTLFRPLETREAVNCPYSVGATQLEIVLVKG